MTETIVIEDQQWKCCGTTYALRVWIDHDLCVYAADLPGCASQGYDGIDECLKNIEEAFRGVAESYKAAGQKIPWQHGGQRPLFHEERHITVTFEDE